MVKVIWLSLVNVVWIYYSLSSRSSGRCVSFDGQGFLDWFCWVVLDRPGQGKLLLSDQLHCVAGAIIGQVSPAGQ